MPSSSSVRSSTEHCVSAPAAATCPPTRSANAFAGASRNTGTVVSSSLKPCATAAAASAAIRRGWSTRFVTCAWIDGVRRARIFCIACRISTGVRRASVAAILAGVMPAVSRVTSARGTAGSTTIRANSTVSSAIASSATVTSSPWRAMNSSIRSNSSSGFPSSSTTRPCSIRRLGSGSKGLENATRPSTGSSGTRLSRLIGRVA